MGVLMKRTIATGSRSGLRRRSLLRAALPLLCAGLTRQAQANAAPLAIIVAGTSPIQRITRAELKRLFLGEPMNLGGLTLVPFNTAIGSPERDQFERLVLGMARDEVAKVWIDRRIRGQARPPRIVPSIQYMVRIAASFPGAIGYVPMSAVTGNVRVLAVDDKLPADPGYPLTA